MGSRCKENLTSGKGTRTLLGASFLLPAVWLVLAASPCGAGDSGTHRAELALAELVATPTVELRGAESRVTLSIPIPERWSVREAGLRFTFVHSAALLDSRSLLVVRWNRRVLAQVPLQARAPQGEVELAVPARLLRPGYNDLEFSVAQNYTEDCSDPQDPVLWTTLELDRSRLEIAYTWKPVPLSLASAVDWLFQETLFDGNDVHLVLPDLSEPSLVRAAKVGAAVAVRFVYRPVNLTLSDRLRSGVDNIVIAEAGFLAGLLEAYGVTPPPGELAILPLPDEKGQQAGGLGPEGRPLTDPGHALIVLSGENEEAVENAVMAFSVLNYPLPDAASAHVSLVETPAVTRYTGRGLLAPGKTYRFEDLGFVSATYRGIDPGSAYLRFRLPSDLLLQDNALAVCSLHLAYGAGMRKDSVLNLYLNDKFTAAVPLDQETGVRFRDYRIMIPMHLFGPGENVLRFEPVLTPLITGRCTMIQTGNLTLTLYEDSSLRIPDMVHWTRMPRLELFFQDGFPFAAWPDWRDSTVLLTGRDEQTAAAAVNLVAMIAQRNGVLPSRIRFAHELSGDLRENVLVVGPFRDVPAPLMEASPLGRGLPYPVDGEIPFVERAGSWGGRLAAWALPGRVSSEPSPRSVNARAVTQAVLGEGNLLLMEYRSPLRKEGSVLVVASGDSEGLSRGVGALWNPYVRTLCRDNLALVEPQEAGAAVVSARAGTDYYLGQGGPRSRLAGFVNVHPLVFAGLLVLCLFLLAWVLLLLVRRRKAQRFGQAAAEGG